MGIHIIDRCVPRDEQLRYATLRDVSAADRVAIDSARAVLICLAAGPTTLPYRKALVNASVDVSRYVGMIPGASAQIFAGGFGKMANAKTVHVPFKGDADGVAALAGGHIEAHVAVPVSYKALAEAKKVRILGVAADSRSALYKDIPTFRENGVDLAIGSFHIVFVPKGTPVEPQARLADALAKAMKEPELQQQMSAASLGIAYLNPKDTARYLTQQDELYRRLIDDLGMNVTGKK